MNGAGTNNNRMDGASYDALGNLIVNPSDAGQYTYDAESRLIQAVNGGLTTKYLYDAEGRRVAKLSGTTVTNEYLFDTDGSQQIELNGSGAVLHTNLYAGGKLIATYNGTDTYFHFTDWLGTRRYEANSAGIQSEICTNLPFGDSQSCTGTPDATEQHFTGKEHDAESGLDYFGARYYANVLGRFVTPDWAAKPASVPYATFGNPQSLNLYGYVENSPVSVADADGHCIPACSVAMWIVQGIATDGPKNFAKNVLTGLAKGAGSFVVNTAKSAVALGQAGSGNPAGAVQTIMIPNPKALQPSNTTQAQVSAATQVTLTVASIVAPAAISSAPASTASAAQGVLDAAIASRAGNPAAMVAAYDTASGATAVGTSGPLSRLGAINPDLAAAADQVGGVGAVNPAAPSPVGCCAEFDAANQLMNQGSLLTI